jgi:putative membrane protein
MDTGGTDRAEGAAAARPAADEPTAEEPDYRFTLANERTFLAWIRTALGLVAAGVAVRQLIPRSAVPGARTTLALACIALAIVLAGASYPRWRQVQLAIGRGEPIPRSPVLPLVAGGVMVIAALAAVLVVRG